MILSLILDGPVRLVYSVLLRMNINILSSRIWLIFNEFPSSPGHILGSLSYGQWWYERVGSTKSSKTGASKWSEDRNSWKSDISAASIYRSLENPSFPISCELGFQQNLNPDQDNPDNEWSKVQSSKKCFSENYSPEVNPDAAIFAWYHDKLDEKPFTQLVASRGLESLNHDVGCRHVSLTNLGETLNQICDFTQKTFTKAKFMRNMLENFEENSLDSETKGVGVSFVDATPRQVLEGLTSKSLTNVQVRFSHQSAKKKLIKNMRSKNINLPAAKEKNFSLRFLSKPIFLLRSF